MTGLNRASGFLILATFAVGISGATAQTAAAASGAQAADKGATVYAAQKCAMCHALDGKGNAKGALDGIGSKLKADEIRQWIVNPAEITAKTKALRKPAMRAYPNLPKEDVDALVAFLLTKKKS